SAVAADTSSRSLAMAGCLLCGLFIAYARLSGGDEHKLAIRSLPASETKVAAVPRVRPPLAQPQEPVAQAAHATVLLPDAEAARERGRDLLVTAAAPEPTPPSSTVNALMLKFAERNAGPAPRTDNWGGTVTATQPRAASKPIPAITSYVPVVFTHKDR